ncbi:protein of unknown function [Vibrio tapetis subsp. tapetis]|uniref:Uncharacterized protein n=1 Tax=Vibrio tapetis subsp. tapetis TaxID=1671868 RepID=A0A2N8ZK06_9VIBR|nr:protein of unknown function [Vibrio tapetis subsp. tapetis]
MAGHSALKPILLPEIMPDIISAIVTDDSKLVNQNCFLFIIFAHFKDCFLM